MPQLVLAHIRVVLQVVQGGHRVDSVAKPGIAGHVDDALAPDPHLPGPVFEPSDLLLSCFGRHGFPPPGRFPIDVLFGGLAAGSVKSPRHT